MKLELTPAMKRRIDKRVKSGQYASPEDVVSAAMMTLEQQEQFGDFAPNELDRLLEKGEQSISRNGTLDGDAAFRQRRAKRHGK